MLTDKIVNKNYKPYNRQICRPLKARTWSVKKIGFISIAVVVNSFIICILLLFLYTIKMDEDGYGSVETLQNFLTRKAAIKIRQLIVEPILMYLVPMLVIIVTNLNIIMRVSSFKNSLNTIHYHNFGRLTI